ncbi:SMP-30/gluconolactonase/LRE family protein [Novosphingobium sp. AP12]|uniref:SMP-30/gluconolactonase/LRE family protein n=1 Tax=Novosphingobium sp. AP12 TaxID=1144305 RepID=UPI000271EC06|nr:SMP-30/gluconolactonase/LRE family protein [Novosphingobium sp. AP12]EJL34394.1 gluconolactonase [Novosphingobium sp. AP12]
MQITKLDAPRCVGGENPVWDERTQTLYYIDNTGMRVHSLDTLTGQSRTLEIPSVITTLVLRESGGAAVTLRTGIHFLDLETGALEDIHPLPATPTYVYNDGKVDARGRFVLGASTTTFETPGPDGGLFRLDPYLRLTQLDAGIHFSNGPCWSPDFKTLYFSDSWLKTTYAYDYDIDTGAIANRRTFIKTDELGGLPDGATVDVDGLVWIAIYGSSKVVAFRPDGSVERMIEMPVRLVSSVAFGGPDLDRLYVTTIAHGIDGAPAEEGAGSLYVIDGLGVSGRLESRFAG